MVVGTLLVKSLLDCAFLCVMVSKCKVFLYTTARCTHLDTPRQRTDYSSEGGRCYQQVQGNIVTGIPGPFYKHHTFASCASADIPPTVEIRSIVHSQETKYLRQCKFGGTYFQGICYLFFHKFEDQKRAEVSCQENGMDLLTDVSEKTTKFLARFLKSKSWNRIWTAGSFGGEGIWIWKKSDGKEIIEYTNWSPGHPPDNDDANGFSIAMNTTTSTWEAVNATEKLEYVCETRYENRQFLAQLEDGKFSLKGDCEGGGKYFNGSCYLYVHSGTSWDSARRFCEDRQMSLLEITSDEEMRFVAFYMKFIFAEYVKCNWIGLRDRNSKKKWVWTGSKTLASYTNWQKRQPDGRTIFNTRREDCAAMFCDEKRTWHDFPCNSMCDFVCEFDAVK